MFQTKHKQYKTIESKCWTEIRRQETSLFLFLRRGSKNKMQRLLKSMHSIRIVSANPIQILITLQPNTNCQIFCSQMTTTLSNDQGITSTRGKAIRISRSLRLYWWHSEINVWICNALTLLATLVAFLVVQPQWNILHIYSIYSTYICHH